MLSAEHKRLLSDLKDQYTDARDWNLRYKEAFKDIHGAELGTLITAMHKSLDLGTYILVVHSAPASTQDDVGLVCIPIELFFNLPQPNDVDPVCVPIELFFNFPQPSILVQCLCPHRAILQPASTQCDVGPVCAPIERFFSQPQPSVMLVQCVIP